MNGTIRNACIRALASILLPAFLYLSATPDALALDPGRRLSQYIYDVWTTDDGLL